MRLAPRRTADGAEVASWHAVAPDGKAIELDEAYTKPARLEAAIGFIPLDVLLDQHQSRRK
jgi:hypothetical protein